MNNFALIRKLSNTNLCRCKFWVICDGSDCHHYEPHHPSREGCTLLSPVKYCSRVRGFVHDIPMADIDSNYDCDPNLAFKAKRDAERRESHSYDVAGKNYDSHAEWTAAMDRKIKNNDRC